MAKHARRSASSAYRWMNCPGSLREIEALPEHSRDARSSYADQGTAAHALAEDCLRLGTKPDAYLGAVVAVDERGDCTFHPEGYACENGFEVDEEMAEAVQVYLDEVQHHRDRLPHAEERLEQRFDLTWLRRDMGGTSDFVLHEPFGELVVVDYKHGAGVVVEVEWNEQAMYYGLGALREAGGPGDVDTVTLVVVQPRARHADGPVRRWTLSAEALWEWGRDVLGPAADATDAPDAPLRAGDWCRFCPAQPTCPAMRQLVQAQAALDFADVPTGPLDPAEYMPPLPSAQAPVDVSTALRAVPVIDAWCRAVEGLAQGMLERGLTVPGYKLVRKRANRRWMDAEGAEKLLRGKRGVKVDDFMEPRKLKSPAKLEKVKGVGKKWVEKHAVKPEGGLTVAHESDPRDGVGAPAISDFASAPPPEGPNESPGEAAAAVDGLDFLA